MDFTPGATTGLYRAMTGAAAPYATARRGAVTVAPGLPRDASVLVLGAGVAGLTAAYELLSAGVERCRVVEAQPRAGGRNFTARTGTVIRETHGSETWAHTCAFDEGLYLNLGPGRIPHHHRRVLRYCRELAVALEVYVMETAANRVHATAGLGGEPLPNRRVTHDTRGHIAERLARSLLENGLPPLDAQRRALCDLLRVFGDLDGDFRYRGSTRAGYRGPMGMYDPWEDPEPAPPLGLERLLASRFWSETMFYQPQEYLWQPTLFQPVGGMDRVVRGFVNALRERWGPERVQLDSPVTGIEALRDGRVRVTWRNGPPGGRVVDHVLCSIPLPVLSRSVALEGFPAPYREAIEHVRFAPTCKVGWQAEERFWESDREQIFGGISYTDHLITQIWYPSNDWFAARGTLTGAYNYEEDAEALGAMSWEQRLLAAREGARELHPERWTDEAVPLEKGLSIAWHRVPFQRGGWADWRVGNARDTEMYRRLLEPHGGFHVLGDQVSPLPGWMEGAMMSAEWVLGQLDGTQPRSVPLVTRVPDSRALTRGLG
ncbi:FAD-dependent oxidoreductase [Streptomyces sp. DSM 44917]|uniref:FAD-dependent oxidoreductase n=1 Tax=Streptomyces boetiae TaxID=3075541 RepID=A0ABU2LDA4_9ACTN|nr:FAD-dependent oxidoreductase [Streptomyces sp. DSM 44917]MDT0309556.1 FAD-dependent oxidoreductase [Streptomyces sp. DSM 44917]